MNAGRGKCIINNGSVNNQMWTSKKLYASTCEKFIGDNIGEFIKGFITSLTECIINLFVGVFKQVLKILKEGIKIFAQSAKILFGKESEQMTPAQKGDAIIKLIGGSVVAIAGIGIEALLAKIGIGEPWSVILSTMLQELPQQCLCIC